MDEIRKPSLLLTVDEYMKTINCFIDEQKFIDQKTLEEILYKAINRDRDYLISVLENEIEKLQNEIKHITKKMNRLTQNYANIVNKISLKNQKIRRRIEEKNQALICKDNLKEKKKIVQNLYDQVFFLFSQFQKTILEIKSKKSDIKNDFLSLRAEFAAISSNNLIILRHTNFNIKMSYENFIESKAYHDEVLFLNEKEKYKRKISKYKNKNSELDNSFREIVDILGKYTLDPKSFLLDFKKKTYEEEIAQVIKDDYPDTKLIAEMLREKCDLIFAIKDSEINECLKKIEIKESHIKEKLRLTIQNCGIENSQKANSLSHSTQYSPRFSPRRDPTDILINHKTLKFASWEESSKLLNQTFDEIEKLRKSRLNMNSDLDLNDLTE